MLDSKRYWMRQFLEEIPTISEIKLNEYKPKKRQKIKIKIQAHWR